MGQGSSAPIAGAERFVNNYANFAGQDYAGFETSGAMPAGSMLAKDSFTVSETGNVIIGPFFLMEKMPKGFSPATGDWRYMMIRPDGSTLGTTGGAGSDNVRFCAECQAKGGPKQDFHFFLPKEYRVKK